VRAVEHKRRSRNGVGAALKAGRARPITAGTGGGSIDPPPDLTSHGSPMTTEQLIARIDALVERGAPFEAVLESAVAALHESDERFDWTGIYELFPDGVLRLGPFVGAPTEHVFIGQGRGICGAAVAERRDLNIGDVTRVADYLACSTRTRSELVVLIRTGDEIYAQIDIDSDQAGEFPATAVQRVRTVADRLARLYAERRHAA
jgi:L-methionine (R)-S-oxide reductase